MLGARAHIEGWGMSTRGWADVVRARNADDVLRLFDHAKKTGRTVGLRGAGRSYGDASLNTGGYVLDCTTWNDFPESAFDPVTGIATLAPGVTIGDLWRRITPLGWWPSVVSGTMAPTIAGAAAMNIHGKNNFAKGPIGDSVLSFDLLSPDGKTRRCSRNENAELFHAAIGSAGLLGLFTRVELKTTKVHSGHLRVWPHRFDNLRQQMDFIESHTGDSDYLVGWVDCFARGDAIGRGEIHRAVYLSQAEAASEPDAQASLAVNRQDLPSRLFGVVPKGWIWPSMWLWWHLGGPPAVRLMNAVKHWLGARTPAGHSYLQPHAAFAFLLDYVPNWKWAYRPQGLIQYQPFVPRDAARDVFEAILKKCHDAGEVPYLGVLKRHRPDPFWLTHAVDGFSLALDFPVRNRAKLWAHCRELDEIVLEAGGRFYFAKDLTLQRDRLARWLPADRLAAFAQLKRELDPDALLQTDLSRRLFGA
jgi:FAD/FMN-containing dehydrogenase